MPGWGTARASGLDVINEFQRLYGHEPSATACLSFFSPLSGGETAPGPGATTPTVPKTPVDRPADGFPKIMLVMAWRKHLPIHGEPQEPQEQASPMSTTLLGRCPS
jgi:hypothetical protein